MVAVERSSDVFLHIFSHTSLLLVQLCFERIKVSFYLWQWAVNLHIHLQDEKDGYSLIKRLLERLASACTQSMTLQPHFTQSLTLSSPCLWHVLHFTSSNVKVI